MPDPRPLIPAVIIACLLLAPCASAGPDMAEETSRLVCDGWSSRYTSDPAVDFAAGFAGEALGVTLENGRITTLSVPDPEGLFDEEAFHLENSPDRRLTATSADALAYRLVAPGLVDNFTFTRLDTDTPNVFWQRLRLADGDLLETFIAASCVRD